MSTQTKKLKRERNLPYRPLPKGEHGGVELLLIHSVDSLGKQGEVVEVRPGYAYNYLIPHGLATLATDHHKRMVDKHKVKLQQIELQRQADCGSWPPRSASKASRSKPTPTKTATSTAASGATGNRRRPQERTTFRSPPTRSGSKARSRNSASTR